MDCCTHGNEPSGVMSGGCCMYHLLEHSDICMICRAVYLSILYDLHNEGRYALFLMCG
jgi:hypothetical protein